MKYCPFCGAELLPGALSFCPECGEALPAPQASVQGSAAPTQEKRRKRSRKSQTAPEVDPNYDGCKNRHPSPICTRFEHHLAGVLAPLSRTEAPKPYNWFSTAKL